MERLTDARRSRCIFCEAADEECAFAAGEFSAPCPDYKRYQRLAAIEDILGDDYDLDRLKVIVNQRMTMREEVAERFRITKDVPVERISELVEADRDGRIVVLPCKVGESLWVHDKDGAPREMEFDPPDIRCHCRQEDNLCMALCSAKNTGVCAYRLRNDGTDLGRKVFLTREAAEAALKGEQNG